MVAGRLSQVSGSIIRHEACSMKHAADFHFVFFTLLFIISTAGCASMKEAARGFVGISTKSLEDARKDAVKNTFSYDYKTSYTKVESVLKEKGSYIYSQDSQKKMIAIYVSELDTTPVGIFFTKIDANNTQIEVSSPSTSAKELISNRIFSALEVSSKPEEKKGTSNAKEDLGNK
jgi:hypothetical protein